MRLREAMGLDSPGYAEEWCGRMDALTDMESGTQEFQDAAVKVMTLGLGLPDSEVEKQ